MNWRNYLLSSLINIQQWVFRLFMPVTDCWISFIIYFSFLIHSSLGDSKNWKTTMTVSKYSISNKTFSLNATWKWKLTYQVEDSVGNCDRFCNRICPFITLNLYVFLNPNKYHKKVHWYYSNLLTES